MTYEDKKLVFEYMGWCPKTRNFCNGKARATFCPTLDDCHQHPLDGNDMVAAMNKMRFTISNEFDNEWQEFFYNSFNGGVVADTCFDLCSNPARFFELMSSWLKEKENEIFR